MPDLTAPDLRSYDYSTPSPETDFSLSSIDNSPPESVEELQKNLAKLSKRAGTFSPKTQRNIDRIAHHGEVLINQLNNLNRTITEMTAAQQHINRSKTKRHIKGISHTGILTIHDANRSIAARKAKEDAANKKRFEKEFKKIYGYEPPQQAL